MRIRSFAAIVFFTLFLITANFGLAQDFKELTKDLEIGFPESKGIVHFPPSSGTPLPRPKMMDTEPGEITLAQDGRILCTIVISPNASLTERNAAAELSGQLAFMSGSEKGPDIVKNVTGVSTPAVCILGTSPELFKSAGIEIPQQHEGFAVKTGRWNGKDAIFIAGRDRFGVYWGVQTLKQMLIKEGEHTGPEWARQTFNRVLAPMGNIADWPDARYRHAICMEYMLENRIQTLAHLVRFGRANTTTMQLMSGREIFDKAIIKNKIDDLHRRGILVLPCIYWVNIDRFLKHTKNRGACPLADMEFIKSLVSTAFESGADGLAIQFDDIAPADLLHHRECPLCSKQFKNIVEPQVYVIQNILAFASRNGWGKKLFVICPTLYSGSGRQYPPYAQIDLTIKNYLPEFCSFPGSENIRFFHCDSTREDRKRIEDFGHKNYAWWNNGPWSGGGGEVWGYSVALARMGYSWGMYDRSLPRSGEERFLPHKLSELKHIKGKTDFIFNGTNDLLGQGIGCMFAWDMEHYMEREPEFQEWYVNNYYGKEVIGDFRAWEWASKPLMSKCLKSQLFDRHDGRLLEAAHIIYDRIQAHRPPKLPDAIISSGEMKKVLDVLESYNSFTSKIRETGEIKSRVSFTREEGCLLSLSPDTIFEEQVKSPAKPRILETWKEKKGLTLAGCSLELSGNDVPAGLSLTDPQGGILTRENIDMDINRFNLLAVPCNLSRGAEITVKVVIDGVEHTGTSTMGHAPEWQELLVPLQGKRLNSFSLYLKSGALDRPEPCRALLRPVRLESIPANTDTFLISGEPLKVVTCDGESGGFFLSKNKIVAADDRFTLSQRSFSVESKLTLVEPTNFKIAGTRATWSYGWTGKQFGGIPGWALGVSGGGFGFTIEDKDAVLSYVSGGGVPSRYTPYHVIAVRDFQNHKLYLYVNGKKVSEADEKGSGIFGDTQRTLNVSFDQWTANYMNGLLNFVKIFDRALSEEEVKERFTRNLN